MMSLLKKPIAWIIAAALALAAVLYVTGSLTRGKRAETEARVTANRAGAAADSASDAVNTVGDRAASDAALDQETRDGIDEIRKAPDAGAADAAARRRLHRNPPDHR